MQIENNRVISMRYVMTNGHGDVLENIMESDPVNYLHGSNSIDRSLQAQLEGLKPGDRKKILLLASPGITTDDFEFNVVIDAVNHATEEEILLGYPVNKYGEKCREDCRCYSNSE